RGCSGGHRRAPPIDRGSLCGTRHEEFHQLVAFEGRRRHRVSLSGDQLHRDRAFAGIVPLLREACVVVVRHETSRSSWSAYRSLQGIAKLFFKSFVWVGCRAQRRLIPQLRGRERQAAEWGYPRFGPTTPTRAERLVDASVDPTEAREDAGHARAVGGTGLE